MMTRRRFLATAGTTALVLALVPSFPFAAFAQDGTVDVEALMDSGPLPEKMLGDPNAKVTVVEYASMTCGHCAAFHEKTYPQLKADYIDTGKVRFVFREFPLDPLAAAGFMLARNAMGDTYFDVVDLLFEKQRDWAYSDDPVTALRTLAKQFGYTDATFEQTLSDQPLLDNINAVRERGEKEFGVNSTPTFFINGQRHRGAMSMEEMAKILDPMLQG
ncbi:DsbA family protein [Mongoliimonas terrestris]|uniref:DsbA family protein n=1 Tax=Mongoliimonas terrestris TaxID=1709001 RepID=UPI0009498D09|nr:thioredoxin domain-containing protein [Mongoliimonas terrestris]